MFWIPQDPLDMFSIMQEQALETKGSEQYVCTVLYFCKSEVLPWVQQGSRCSSGWTPGVIKPGAPLLPEATCSFLLHNPLKANRKTSSAVWTSLTSWFTSRPLFRPVHWRDAIFKTQLINDHRYWLFWSEQNRLVLTGVIFTKAGIRASGNGWEVSQSRWAEPPRGLVKGGDMWAEIWTRRAKDCLGGSYCLKPIQEHAVFLKRRLLKRVCSNISSFKYFHKNTIGWIAKWFNIWHVPWFPDAKYLWSSINAIYHLSHNW